MVFSAFVGELPRYRDVKFKDGNQLNTNYKNLLPHHKESLLSTEFMPVKGLNNVFINSTGTEIYQDNYSVNIRVIISNNKEYLMCTLNTNKLSQNFYISNLVAFAWLNWNGKGHIIYIDNNTKNNFYKNLKILSVQEYKKHNSILLNRKIKR